MAPVDSTPASKSLFALRPIEPVQSGSRSSCRIGDAVHVNVTLVTKRALWNQIKQGIFRQISLRQQWLFYLASKEAGSEGRNRKAGLIITTWPGTGPPFLCDVIYWRRLLNCFIFELPHSRLHGPPTRHVHRCTQKSNHSLVRPTKYFVRAKEPNIGTTRAPPKNKYECLLMLA